LKLRALMLPKNPTNERSAAPARRVLVLSAGIPVLSSVTVGRLNAAVEPPWMGSRRVTEGRTGIPAWHRLEYCHLDYVLNTRNLLDRRIGRPRLQIDEVVGDIVAALVDHIRDVDVLVCQDGQDLAQHLRYVAVGNRSEEHTSELQSRENLVCRLLLEKIQQEEIANQK